MAAAALIAFWSPSRAAVGEESLKPGWESADGKGVDAAHFPWLPLGQMLVERGLLTPEELEQVLQAQEQSGRPLGEIIVEWELISGPTLALTLAEQCGVELKTDSGFGTGLWHEIQRRHEKENRRRLHLRAVPAVREPIAELVSPVEDDETVARLAEVEEPGSDVASTTRAHAQISLPAAELEDVLEGNGRVGALEAEENAGTEAPDQLSGQALDRVRLREVAKYRVELAATSGQLNAAQARVAELEDALQERHRHVEELEAEHLTRTQALEQLSEQLANSRNEFSARIESLETELQQRDAQIARLERSLPEADKKTKKDERAFQKAQAALLNERKAVERERQKLRTGLESLKRERKELASLQRSLRDEVALTDDRAQKLSKQLDGLESERNAITTRTNKVHEREVALEAHAAELADRERRLDARMQPAEARSVELADRARDVADREQAVAGRLRAVLTAAADLERRRRSLEQPEHAIAQRDAEREQRPEEPDKPMVALAADLRPEPELAPPPAEAREFPKEQVPAPHGLPAPTDAYHWNLDTLYRLAQEHADAFPHLVDEWKYTLFYLRNETRSDGALPHKFDSLVEETFGELLGSA